MTREWQVDVNRMIRRLPKDGQKIAGRELEEGREMITRWKADDQRTEWRKYEYYWNMTRGWHKDDQKMAGRLSVDSRKTTRRHLEDLQPPTVKI